MHSFERFVFCTIIPNSSRRWKTSTFFEVITHQLKTQLKMKFKVEMWIQFIKQRKKIRRLPVFVIIIIIKQRKRNYSLLYLNFLIFFLFWTILKFNIFFFVFQPKLFFHSRQQFKYIFWKHWIYRYIGIHIIYWLSYTYTRT